MTALRDAGLCYTMILRLEGPGGMNDDIRAYAHQRFAQVAMDINSMAFRPMDCGQRCSKGCCLLGRTPANQQTDAFVAGKAARDIAAEISIAADDEDARYHVGFVTISQKMATNPPNAGQPRMNHVRNRRL